MTDTKDQPTLIANYYRAKPNHGNASKKGQYALTLQRVTDDVLEALEDDGIPLLNHHGVLVWHKHFTTSIPEAQDMQIVNDSSDFGRFLKRHFMLMWETGKARLHPGQPRDVKTPVVTYGELKSDLIGELTRIESLELTPHYPARSDAHYVRDPDTYDTTDADGSSLDGLVDLLNANTDEDRNLMKAMIISAFWGGPYSETPLFVIRAPHGSGSGKTETMKIVERLLGGATWVAPEEGKSYYEKIKRDLGTPEQAINRLVVLDNVESKSGCLRDPGLAALITGSKLPLDRLFHGAYQPPNDKIWTMTLNGERFSTDLANRSVIIDVGPQPEVRSASPQWDDPIPNFGDVWTEYVDDHREEIIADCLSILEGKDKCDLGSVHADRWSQWAYAVLTKIDNGDTLYQLVQDRQGDMDKQTSEASDLVDLLKQKMKVAGIDPDDTNVCIPTNIVIETVADHMGENPDHWSARSMWPSLSIYEKTKPFQKYGLKATSGRDSTPARNRGLVWYGGTGTTIMSWGQAKTSTPIMGKISSTGPDIGPSQNTGSSSDSARSSDSIDGSGPELDQNDQNLCKCTDCGTEHDNIGDMLGCECGVADS